MVSFIGLHLRHDRTRSKIVGGQSVQVAIQMGFHLALSLNDKSKTDSISESAGQESDAKCSRKP